MTKNELKAELKIARDALRKAQGVLYSEIQGYLDCSMDLKNLYYRIEYAADDADILLTRAGELNEGRDEIKEKKEAEMNITTLKWTADS